MRSSARRSNDYYAQDELWPGERIAPARAGGIRRILPRGLVVLGIGGVCWVLITDAGWREWTFAKAGALYSAIDSGGRDPPERRPQVNASVPPVRVVPPQPRMPIEEAPPLRTASLPMPAAAPASTPYEEPPPTPPGSADPYRKKAEAVGLHPGLSRVVLERLSEADYRNAGLAIKTAVAQIGDDSALLWPPQREANQALFKVRFVPGAAPNCRRYVVTITKDRWQTTALPMEKCGVQTRTVRRE